jgi:hypothetical protein
VPSALAAYFTPLVAASATQCATATVVPATATAAHAATAAFSAASTLVAIFTRTARTPARITQRVLWLQLF